VPRTPIHPDEILADELAEIGVSAAELPKLFLTDRDPDESRTSERNRC
jgi:hypothetical protein